MSGNGILATKLMSAWIQTMSFARGGMNLASFIFQEWNSSELARVKLTFKRGNEAFFTWSIQNAKLT